MIEIALVFIYLVGAAASNSAQRIMGMRNPDTIYDSFTGDDICDALCVVAWPVFWPCWLAHWLTKRLMERTEQ